MYYAKPMSEVKREIRARKYAAGVDLRQMAKDYVKGFIIVVFFFALILGWEIAFAQPTGYFDPNTGITTWQ